MMEKNVLQIGSMKDEKWIQIHLFRASWNCIITGVKTLYMPQFPLSPSVKVNIQISAKSEKVLEMESMIIMRCYLGRNKNNWKFKSCCFPL